MTDLDTSNMSNAPRDILAQEFSAVSETGYADAASRGFDDPIITAALRAMARSVGVERERCIAILQLARQGEIDTDLRSLIHGMQRP